MLFNSVLGSGGRKLPISFNLIGSPSNYSSISGGTITMPSGIQSGDVILIYQVAGYGQQNSYPTGTVRYGNGFTGANTKTGYYLISSTSYYTHIAAVSYKKANGTESNTNISGFISQSAWDHTAILFLLRPNKNISSISISNITTVVTTADPPQYTINSLTNSEIIYYLNCGFSNVPTIVTTPNRLASAVGSSGGTYARLNGGIWISSTPSQYSFDSASCGIQNIPLGGRLIIS